MSDGRGKTRTREEKDENNEERQTHNRSDNLRRYDVPSYWGIEGNGGIKEGVGDV